MNVSGKFLVIDGPDGSGKSTQLTLLTEWLGTQGADVLTARDPGGTAIGERIRHVLLDYDLATMEPRCETLLFMASRAQLVGEIIRPALERGQTVVCDRFISATYAYQGAAGFPRQTVIDLGRHAVGETWPDLTLVLDVPPEVGMARTGRRPHQAGKRARGAGQGQTSLFDGSAPDAMERRPLDFHRRVRELFRELPDVYPRPVVLIDASRPADTVFTDIQEAVRRALA
jgi:dTMP kinase